MRVIRWTNHQLALNGVSLHGLCYRYNACICCGVFPSSPPPQPMYKRGGLDVIGMSSLQAVGRGLTKQLGALQ